MSSNLSSAWRFFLERWVQKGVLHQLLLMTTLVVLVALSGGFFAWIGTEQFSSAPEAFWWAFLRLTDPGYLGDDQGLVLRVVSTSVTVLGYVIFMGSLIAIMTQGLARTLRNLESGLTPISMREHVVVLGWTNRTPEIVLKLLGARGRLARFLEQLDVRKLRVVILSETVDAQRRLELREYLGEHWSDSQVFIRSGSSLQPDHLKRLDLVRASTVVVPGADFELDGAEASDTRVIKTLLTLNNLLAEGDPERRPYVVAEIFDPLKLPLAQRSMDDRIEVIASNRVISRLVTQSVRHRGLARVLFGILSHREGNSIYVRGFPHLAGRTVASLHESFPHAILLGFVRTEGDVRSTDLDPLTSATLREDDLLVLLAETFDRCAPQEPLPEPMVLERRDPPRSAAASEVCRILVLGWSHKIGVLVGELGECRERFELSVMSRVSISEREHWFRRVDLSREGVQIQHIEGDYALEGDLAQLELESFDYVVFLASDFMPSSEQADARTILGYVLLRSVLAQLSHPPEVLIELLDPDNEHLFAEEGTGRDAQLVTPRILSYMLAHVALRPELNSAFDELFCAGGYEIALRSASELGLAGRDLDFPALRRSVLEVGMITLGVFPAGGSLELNPARDRRWTLDEADRIVLLAPQRS